MTATEILDVATFFGTSLSPHQVDRLMDEVRKLSITERAYLLDALPGGPLYTAMSEHAGEMGGLR